MWTAGLAAGQTTPSEEKTKPPFEFADAAPLTVADDKLVSGIDVEILNNKADDRELRLALTDFKLRDVGGAALSNEQALRLPDQLRLPGGNSGVITLTLAEGARIGRGEYSGRLAISDSKSDHVERRQITISVDAADPKVAPVPATDKLSIVVTRTTPFSESDVDIDGAELPLDVPLATTAGDLDLSAAEPLGFVTREGALVGVGWNGKLVSVADDRALALPLDFFDLRSDGTYEGNVELVDRDGKPASVALSVRVTDSIFWPAVALLVGILLAWLVKRRIGMTRPVDELLIRLDDIVVAFEEGDKEFKRKSRDKPYSGYDISRPLHESAEGLKRKLDDLKRGAGVEPDKKDYDEAVKELGTLLDLSKNWRTFADELQALEHAVEAAHDPRVTGVTHLPAIFAEAEEVLRRAAPGSLKGFSTLRDRVLKLSGLLPDWRRMVTGVDDLRALATELLVKGPGGAQKAELDAAIEQLNQVENELWRLTTSTANLGTTKAAMQRVQGILDKYRRPSRPEAMSPEASRVTQEAMSTVGTVLGLATRTEERLSQAFGNGFPWGSIGKELRRRRVLFDLAIVAIAVLVALVAGLNALYVGKAFGGWLDYLAALLWGITTETTLAVFFAALARLGARIPGSLATVPQLATTTGPAQPGAGSHGQVF